MPHPFGYWGEGTTFVPRIDSVGTWGSVEIDIGSFAEFIYPTTLGILAPFRMKKGGED
jgi:hypothetical protein